MAFDAAVGYSPEIDYDGCYAARAHGAGDSITF
jgi:hypothetical protein